MKNAEISTIGARLKAERERLGMTQPPFAEVAGAKKRTLIDWEQNVSSPTAQQLQALARIGVDVAYVVTGGRTRDGGVREVAVHQAVLDAVELLSLEKKVDGQQLAKAVVKLALKSVDQDASSPNVSQVFHGDVGQQVTGDITHKAPVTFNVGRKKK